MPATNAPMFTDARALIAPFDINPAGLVYRNPNIETLYQAAVQRGQAEVLANGALHVSTLPFVGRAAKSAFLVNDPDALIDGQPLDALIDWGNPSKGEWDNLPMAPKVYHKLRARVIEALSQIGDLYVIDGFSGRTERTRLNVRVITGHAQAALFSRQIFNRLDADELSGFEPGWTVLQAPEAKPDPEDGTNGGAFIITDLANRLTIIGGTKYNGQIKKSIFAAQNFLLPLKGILTMHAGASEGTTGLSAIHAGLSGTGKTTLSNTGYPVADDQIVIDLDAVEDEVVSNMEGGQYAKTEHLRREKEPETYDAIRYGATLENIYHVDGVVDYDNTSLSANGRTGYPLDFVSTAKPSGMTRAPANITFLTADGFGVLPPVARLSVEAGKFHFACGFTSKMPGTEEGVTEAIPTFSAFFGKPFMPLKPVIYMDLLAALMEKHNTQVWLVNTGWLGAARPGRERVDILTSKAIINAIRDGQIDDAPENFVHDPIFNLDVPKAVPGVDGDLLDPKNAWADQAAYRATANKLAGIFQNAIAKLNDIPASVIAAGPKPQG
ncbi:phosphoenolpyruvate carboxykinase (ATP) [Myxococcota bacterium]|nr:phosphoenolpyruvate carboxykinase (ATP) [Myxococcota bacterium]MBU1432122.1 phosphoenolpyruvate carboxykinase (ATP) [Myxococcota bacterium]MBU1900325.1 phosphoenolpyruvate carboxykinase (ATP) [Myxococcota bacterium]